MACIIFGGEFGSVPACPAPTKWCVCRVLQSVIDDEKKKKVRERGTVQDNNQTRRWRLSNMRAEEHDDASRMVQGASTAEMDAEHAGATRKWDVKCK